MIKPLLMVGLLAAAGGDDDTGPYKRGTSWDAEVHVGYTFFGVDDVSDRFLVRMRGGLLWVHEPFYLGVGATLEAFGPPEVAGGFELSLTHLWSGLWAQAGASLNRDADFFFHGAVGYTLVGIEYQRRLSGSPGADKSDAFLILIRLPVGIYSFG